MYSISLILNLLTPNYLRSIRTEALRKRIWYRVLDRLEQGIVNLTIKIVDTLRSDALIRILVGILAKLREAGKSTFVKHIEGYGVEQMWRIVEISIGLGNRVADGWLCEGFAEWFALNSFYNSTGWRNRV